MGACRYDKARSVAVNTMTVGGVSALSVQRIELGSTSGK